MFPSKNTEKWSDFLETFSWKHFSKLKSKVRKTETWYHNFERIYRIFKLSTGLKLLKIIAISTYALVQICLKNSVLGLSTAGCFRLAINCWSGQRLFFWFIKWKLKCNKIIAYLHRIFWRFFLLISFLQFSPIRWSCVFCFFPPWSGDHITKSAYSGTGDRRTIFTHISRRYAW